MKKIIISTGGTGGHVIPAQILYDYLTHNNQIIITIDKRGISYINKRKYKIKQIEVPKLNSNIISFIPFLIKFILSIIKSYLFLNKNKIEILISTGGYMSVPVCLAARFLNLKIFLFEPNLVIGRSNLFLLNYCEKIFTYNKKIRNFPKKMRHKNLVINPLIKKEIILTKKNLKRKSKLFSLLIIGGSQGAKKFDRLFNEDLIKLSKRFKIKIYHQTSIQNLKKLKNFYVSNNIDFYAFSYNHDLHKIIKKCDFAISRSGASTVNELVFLETPFLLIPYPHAKDDHQFFNAKYYVNKNLGWLIRETDIKKNFLYKFVTNLIKNKKLIFQKKKNMYNFHNRYDWNSNSNQLNNFLSK